MFDHCELLELKCPYATNTIGGTRCSHSWPNEPGSSRPFVEELTECPWPAARQRSLSFRQDEQS